MKKTTACALDCYDACKIVVDNEGKLKADADHPFGNGALCSVLNRYMPKSRVIKEPSIDGRVVSMDEALDECADVLLRSTKSLLWRGSGNVGVMQEITNLLMQRIGGYLTHGSLCDGAGAAGIIASRGLIKNPPLEQIKKSESVVVWGRNPTVTNSHMMPFLEGKNLIVIDPVTTQIAKKADIHLRIAPRSDYYLAIILARFVFMAGREDVKWLDSFASEYEDFYDFTREHRIKSILNYIGTDIGELGNVLDLIYEKKCLFLVGTGVQKYSTGSYVLQAIDALAACLGLFGKEGCGVHYLGDSKLGFENPFEVTLKSLPKATTAFEEFETVLVQGGNPAHSMPNSSKVRKSLESVKNLIYFGLHENETSKRARIVIPAKTFLQKDDIRLSYTHHYVQRMRDVQGTKYGISEYEFVEELFKRMNLPKLEPQEYYLEFWLSQCKKLDEDLYRSPAYEPIPYADGFGCDCEDEFRFIDQYEDEFMQTKSFYTIRADEESDADDEYWLLTPKSPHSINSQFERDKRVFVHPSLGFLDSQKVKLISSYSEAVFEVCNSEDVRDDCVVVYSSSIDVNMLTPPILSEHGDSACFQEVKVKIETI